MKRCREPSVFFLLGIFNKRFIHVIYICEHCHILCTDDGVYTT